MGVPNLVPMSYAAITHREPIPFPALPDVSAGRHTSFMDPVMGTTITRVTDARNEGTSNVVAGANGRGTTFHTTSAADHNTFSLNDDYFYYMNSGGATIAYGLNPATGVPFPLAPTTNSPDYAGNTSGTPFTSNVGTRHIGLRNEPDFSYERSGVLIGSLTSAAAGHPTIAEYHFANDTYPTIIDLASLGFNVASGAPDYGDLLAYTSLSNADAIGFYGTAHGERICALFGSANADYSYLVAFLNIDGSVVRILDTRHNMTGTNSSNMAWAGFNPGAQVATTLNGGIDASVQTITVGATTKLTVDGVVRIDNEYITYTSKNSTQLLGCTRGAHGSTAATHSNATNVTPYGYDLHGATMTRDGRYAYLTRADRTLPTPGSGSIYIYDVQANTVVYETLDNSGHHLAGFNRIINQNGRQDAMDWEVRQASDPNNAGAIYYVTGAQTNERYNIAIDGLTVPGNFGIADHSSGNNAKPTQPDAPFFIGDYRYFDGTHDPYDFTWRANAEWDDEIFAASPKSPGVNQFWRFTQHRSKVRGSLKATGTVSWSSSSNPTTLTGSGTSFLSQVAVGDPISVNSWDGSSTHTLTSGESRIVTAIADDTHLTVDTAFTTTATGQNLFVAFKGSGLAVFYFTPRPNVSQKGRFALYTSNWNGRLGVPYRTDTSHDAFRTDVFLVALPTNPPTAPTLSSITVDNQTDTTVRVNGTVGTAIGDFTVQYSIDTDYDSWKADYLLATGARTVTITGLAAGTTYNYRVVSRNRGAASSYTTGTFTTTGGEEEEEEGNPVTWTTLVNATVLNTDELTKTGGSDGSEDAGAVSVETIASGNGFVQFTVPPGGYPSVLHGTIGLSNDITGTAHGITDFCLKLSTGFAEYRDNGSYQGEFAIAAGDVIKIAVEGGNVKYYKNGSVLRTITAPTITYPLYVDASLYKSGALLKTVLIRDN